MMKQGGNAQAELDQAARDLGFPDYATWVAYQRNQGTGVNVREQAPQQPMRRTQAQMPPQEENFLQYIFRRIPPFSLIGDSAQKYERVAPKGKSK